MDGRIFFVGNRQLSAIRTQDLPMLTRAICGFERGLVSVERCYKKQVAYIRLFCKEFEVRVLANDWNKLLPFLSTQGPLQYDPPFTTNARDVSNIEVWDPVFYKKVYDTLQMVFTQSYPTSKL